MFDPRRYAEHASKNDSILGDDFTRETDLLEKVNHGGEINDVRYTVSTGCVAAPVTIDYYDEEEMESKPKRKKKTKTKSKTKSDILEVGFLD